MFAGEHGDGVGANFVRGVSIRRNPIGANDNEIDAALPHQRSRHVVGDHGRVDAVAHQLPRGQARALKEGTRFVGEHGDFLAGLDRAADHTQRGAVAGGGERPGVAMRQDPGVGGHDLGPKRAHRPAACDVFVVNRLRLGVEAVLDLIDRCAGLDGGGKHALHPIDRPKQVDRGWPRRRHEVTGFREFRGKLLRPGSRAPAHPEGNAERRGDANCRRAADHHRPNRPCHFRSRLAADVDLLRRQLALIDHDDHVVFAGNRGQHR